VISTLQYPLLVRWFTVVPGSLNDIMERAAFALIHSPLSIYSDSTMRRTDSFDEARKSMKRVPSFSVVVTDPDVSSDEGESLSTNAK
jgi:hypothetical protein